MTAIALRDGEMAADRLLTAGEGSSIEKIGFMCKIAKAGDYYVGFAGDAEIVAMALKEHIDSGEPTNLPQGEIDGIAYHVKTEAVYMTNGVHWHRVYGPFFAIGTASPAALAAMHAHPSVGAVKAVHAAMQVYACVGGGINRLRLGLLAPELVVED